MAEVITSILRDAPVPAAALFIIYLIVRMCLAHIKEMSATWTEFIKGMQERNIVAVDRLNQALDRNTEALATYKALSSMYQQRQDPK